MKKIILTDVDGCAIKWQGNLIKYVKEQGYTKYPGVMQCWMHEKFVSPSDLFDCDHVTAMKHINAYHDQYVSTMPAYPDALDWINNSDFEFIAITAIGTSEKIKQDRIDNLNELFPGKFIDILFCGAGESKIDLFNNIKSRYDEERIVMFIDDLAENINDCQKVFPDIPKYHIVRGERERPKVPYHAASSMAKVFRHWKYYYGN